MGDQIKFDFDPKAAVDPKAAREGRDAGIGLVLAHNVDWHLQGLMTLATLLGSGQEMTGEDMRLYLTPRIGKPKHHNAWGGLVRTFVAAHLLPVVRLRAMRTKASHARRTPVYRL